MLRVEETVRERERETPTKTHTSNS